MLWNNFQDQFSSLRHCATLRIFGLHFSRLQIYPGSFSLNYFAINWLYAGLWCTSSWLSCDPQCVAADLPWPNFDSPIFLSQLWSERSFKMNKNWNQSLFCWLKGEGRLEVLKWSLVALWGLRDYLSWISIKIQMESWQFKTISLQPDWLIETGDWQFLMFDSSSTPSVSHNLHNLDIAKFTVLSSASLDGFSVLLLFASWPSFLVLLWWWSILLYYNMSIISFPDRLKWL